MNKKKTWAMGMEQWWNIDIQKTSYGSMTIIKKSTEKKKHFIGVEQLWRGKRKWKHEHSNWNKLTIEKWLTFQCAPQVQVEEYTTYSFTRA